MKLYHISQNPNLTTLIPLRPRNGWTEYGIENGTIERISFAPTIMGCVRGVDNFSGKDSVYYVYQPTSISPKYLVQPTMRQVPDVNYTKEVWYTKPVNVIRVGAIQLKGTSGFKWISIGKKGGRIKMAVFKYKYNKINAPQEDERQTRKERIKRFILRRIANFYSNKQ